MRGRNDPTTTTFRGYETPRTQEFALLTFLVVQVLTSQGERRLPPQKGTSKDAQGFGPYQNKPFRGPHNKKRGHTPMGATPLKAVTNRFPQAGGNQISEVPRVIFNTTLGDEDVETPPPNDSLKASLRRLPPFFQKRLANKQMSKQRVKHYHQFLPEFL